MHKQKDKQTKKEDIQQMATKQTPDEQLHDWVDSSFVCSHKH